MTNLVRFTPTSDVRRIQRELDRMFDSFFPTRSGASEDGETTMWNPRVDLAETDEAYLIHADVPGMNKDDIQINYREGVLSISGERKASTREEDTNYVRVERSVGRFYRAFTLPQAINLDDITATYEDGVLDVTVPKADEQKPRRISIS